MPVKQYEMTKLFFSIREVSTMLDVNHSVLRFWEKEFEMLRPRKSKRGDRHYSKEDIELLKMIHHLTKVKGYTIEGARNKIVHNPEEAKGQMELKESLLKVRGFLVELKNTL
jgi:DNA-binding transcriptional MerR regulator